MGIGGEDKKDIHVDQDDAKGPDVGGSRPVRRGTVVSTLKAHVWSASTVHVGTLCFGGRKAKVRQLDDDTTFTIDNTVSDNKILWFDVTVKDALLVTGGNSVAHLGEHAGNQPQTGGAEELRWMEGSEQGGGRGSPRRGGCNIFWGDGCRLVMVTCLFQEVKQIFAGNVLQQQEQEGRCVKCAIEGDDVGVGTERLMDSDLWEGVNIGAYSGFPRGQTSVIWAARAS